MRYAAQTVGFWDSFWPTLAAGVIAGLVTGLIVGLAIWRVQKASDERRFERDAMRELARFRRRLLQRLVQPDLETVVIGRAANSARRATELATFIESQPVDEWRETLPDERGLLDLLTSVVESHAVRGRGGSAGLRPAGSDPCAQRSRSSRRRG